MPAPRKRESELQRPRSRKGSASTADVTKGEARAVRIPHGDPNWHPAVKRLYDSLRTSGQTDFYQNSDWAYAWFVMEQLDRFVRAGRPSAQMFQALDTALERLMLTETSRRKARIELERPQEDTGPSLADSAIADYQAALEAAAMAPEDDDDE